MWSSVSCFSKWRTQKHSHTQIRKFWLKQTDYSKGARKWEKKDIRVGIVESVMERLHKDLNQGARERENFEPAAAQCSTILF